MKRILSFMFNADSLFGKLLCGLIYILVYDFIFYNFIYDLFEYMGVEYITMSPTTSIVWIVLSLIPIIFYKGIHSVSSFFTIFIYILIYIPLIHSLFITWGLPETIQYSYALILCILLTMYFSISTNRLIFKSIQIVPSISFKTIEVFTLLITLVFIAFRAREMHFVNFITDQSLLYSLREENSENASGLGPILYLQGWLSGAFYPFLLISYLSKKAWKKTPIIIAGYITLFMVDMQKLTFFLPFALIGLYFLMKTGEKIITMRFHSIMMYVIIVISLLLYSIKDDEIGFVLGFIVLLRTVCVVGWLSQMYIHFFAENPFTHYSHIGVVNAITNEYPYDKSLGIMVSHGSQNANANFLLTDGIAAWGVGGLIVIGIFFYFLLQLINSISTKYNKTDLLVIFVPTLSYLLNTSLFTTLLTSGLIILLLLLMAYDNENENKTTKQETNNDKSLIT